jgi:CHASE3 domain sensor protein
MVTRRNALMTSNVSDPLGKKQNRLFRDYFDLDKQRIETEMFKLQRSQSLTTWALLAVAAVVGAATVVSIVIALLN